MTNAVKAARTLVGRVLHYAEVLGPTSAVLSVLGKLSGRTFSRKFDAAGVRHPVLLRLPSTDIDAYEQIFVEKQYEFSPGKPPAVIVDAGANIGLASIFFAQRFPSAKIYAIECESSNFAALEANVAPFPNVIPIHAALWDHDGSISVVDPGLGKMGFMTQAAPDPAGRSSPVPALTVESVMTGTGSRRSTS
jgi:FkbM family methyltransferase